MGHIPVKERYDAALRKVGGVYAVKVMTSFGYEIMLTRGCWFQTLDVNKPWRQIPVDRLHFLVFTHFFFWLPQGNTKSRNFVQIKPRYWKKC